MNETTWLTQILDGLIGLMGKLPEPVRLELIRRLNHAFCQHCGKDQRGTMMGCQCWNDE